MVEEVLETSMDEFISAGFTANKDELISLLQYTQKKN